MTDFFLAGIIQGSIAESRIHDQEYRATIQETIERAVPDASVYCPVTEYPNSLSYDEAKGRRVFFGLMERAATTDVLVAFLPEASMGTAIEMWQAYHAGKVVLAVTDLGINWAVRFLADRILPDVAALEEFLAGEEFRKLLAAKESARRRKGG